LPKHNAIKGFTLIEVSIVLVIIGLIVGGVLVGQNLITAAEVRATISQVEKYNQAANTFRGKFGYLPGDINATAASQFGFAARGVYAGQGDGNGILEGNYNNSTSGHASLWQSAGETVMFWVDLSSPVAGNLIDGGFNTASSTAIPASDITGTAINLYFPQAKIGRGNYFYTYSSYFWNGSNDILLGDNYFGLSAVYDIEANSANGRVQSNRTIPVAQAYAIDKKVDDGLPESGNVIAMFLSPTNGDLMWAQASEQWAFTSTGLTVAPGQIPASSTTCFDNGNIAAATATYSMNQNNGAGANCALSFKMQ